MELFLSKSKHRCSCPPIPIPQKILLLPPTVIAVFFLFLLLPSITISQGQQHQNSQEGGQDQAAAADYFKREHSLSKPYQGSGWEIPYWDFYGSTIVTNQYIRLTPDVRSQIGGIWNNQPVRMKNWETHVQFQVHGKGKDLFGDGFAIWYARDRMSPGGVFGSQDLFYGLAIILDTYSNHNGPHNHQHPYISAMINNGTLAYDHDRDGTLTQIAGCEAKFRNSKWDSYISIRYENDVLTVSTDISGKQEWKECFRVTGIRLPTSYYYGLSAATGDLSDNHDIISFRTYELDVQPLTIEERIERDQIIPSALNSEPPRTHHEDPPAPKTSGVVTGLKILLYIIIGLIVIGLIGAVAFYAYQHYQQNSRKRFY